MARDLENTAMMDWVRRVGDEALFVVSLCDGAFVLAAAGLLDGHECTTFPGDQDRFAEASPELDLVREVSFVHDGKALTSQGGARSFDVAMYLVDLGLLTKAVREMPSLNGRLFDGVHGLANDPIRRIQITLHEKSGRDQRVSDVV